MKILATIYLWLMIGDMIVALGRWRDDTGFWERLFWPTRIWFTVTQLIHDWRKDLYHRTKHL